MNKPILFFSFTFFILLTTLPVIISKETYQPDLHKSHQKILSEQETSECLIKNCELCSSSTCQKCRKGFKILKNSCISEKNHRKSDLDSTSLLIILICLASFLAFFCTGCVYIARKYRHKYSDSPMIEGVHTKQSSLVSEQQDVNTDVSVVVLSSPSLNQASSQRLNGNREVESNVNQENENVCFVCFGHEKNEEVQFECGHFAHRQCLIGKSETCIFCGRKESLNK